VARRSGTEIRKRGSVLTARFSAQEAAAIRRLADESGQSQASLIRQALLGAAPPPAVVQTHRASLDQAAVAKVLAQLGKIGSNVNQLAHYAHLGRFHTNSIEVALRDLSEMRSACLEALGHEKQQVEPQAARSTSVD